jgi:hypothetical protein
MHAIKRKSPNNIEAAVRERQQGRNAVVAELGLRAPQKEAR